MSQEFDFTRVRNGLRACSEAGLRVFGSDVHRFELNPRLPSKEINEFEHRHHISLPVDYRRFLLEVGNGGAGPYYGLFPLGLMDDNWGTKAWSEGDGFVGLLKEPFPHHESWNLFGMPPDDLADSDEAEYDRLATQFERRYWDSALVNGAVPVCHMGCALRVWLVVSGSEVGHLWRDGRAELSGLRPLVLKDSSRATFARWYREWLDDCLQSLSCT
jgi:hypothetical protein